MYDKEETGAKNEKAIERSKQRALNSSLISELVHESTDSPMEVSHHSNLKSKVLRDQEDRNRFEEEYMTRVMVSKKQRSQERRNLQRSELDTISKFGNIGALEDVHETMQKKKSKGKGRLNKRLKHKKRKFK
uniref:Neuroguidin-like n=1 Tax=Phallusia mammillata TaxID=59560 RepID=A0A6F9DMU8_9ASCI|nr:neuroguidin-like [Phallusia mammillata]